MTRRDIRWFAAAAALVLIVCASAPAFPQETPAPQTPQEAKATVEEILQQQEALLRGQRFSYDPAGRRDPFRSLYEQVRTVDGRDKIPGVAGMLVAEIDLSGIVKDKGDGDVAFFNGSDNKGYFLRVGDRVYDGTVIAIDARRGVVTFRQQVDDPRRIKPYIDVKKRLVPVEEESAQ
jgi:type IV pilus assembly protein PilP